MPEGDTLFRLAAKLRPALVGKEVLELSLPRSELGEVVRLVGRKVSAVEARGKNLLIHFDDGSALHTHLRMTGSWRLHVGSTPPPGGAAWIVATLRVVGATAVCHRAPVVRLLRPGAAAKDPRLRAIGPDLLAETFDVESARRRLRALAHEPLGVAIMDQHAVAGIGNVFKSEILFLRGLDPFRIVDGVSDAELDGVLAVAVELLAKNVRDTPRSGRAWPYAAGRTTRAGSGSGKGPVHVYGRSGRPCFVCGATIRMERQGTLRRSTYFCPDCQRVNGHPDGTADGLADGTADGTADNPGESQQGP